MIRLAWRQFRAEALIAGGALTTIALVLAITGPQLVSVFRNAPDQLAITDQAIQIALGALLVLTPALIGIFLGAPLIARELETGTFRLAWTQGITRTRWFVVKVALVGSASSLLAGGLSLVATWWANPINIVNHNRFGAANFGTYGIVPFGYGLFAFALGVTVGLVFRKTLLGMAFTLVGYTGIRQVVTFFIRPHFASPVRAVNPLTLDSGFDLSQSSGLISVSASPPNIPNGWGLSATIVDNHGHVPTSAIVNRFCSGLSRPDIGGKLGGGTRRAIPDGSGINECITHLAAKYHEVVLYQPAGRYWLFQGYELALFVALSLALLALSLWWLHHRLT